MDPRWMVLALALASPVRAAQVETGEASVYDDKFEGRTTANGDTFTQERATAASKTLPLGSKAKVTNLENGRSTKLEINDRGPYVDGRVIDLSEKAAKKLDVEGLAPVEVQSPPPKARDPARRKHRAKDDG